MSSADLSATVAQRHFSGSTVLAAVGINTSAAGLDGSAAVCCRPHNSSAVGFSDSTMFTCWHLDRDGTHPSNRAAVAAEAVADAWIPCLSLSMFFASLVVLNGI